MNLESICDLIVVVGAAYFTIIKIINSFAKPSSKIKKKQEEKERERTKQFLNEIMPEYFKQYDEEFKKLILQNENIYINKIKGKVVEELREELKEIKNINKKQNKQLDELNEKLVLINNSSKDVMRQKIMAIYHNNKKQKTLSIYDKEALDELYKDYKSQLGNSYIDKYYNRMKNWHIIDEILEEN